MKGIKKRLTMACSACLLSWSGLALAQAQLNVLEVEGALQRAISPSELVKIEAQGELTMRALRAFNLLPDSFMGLAMELRRANIDLLAATVAEVRALQPQIEEGNLKADKEAYDALLSLLDTQAYLEWEMLEKDTTLNADEPLLVRGDGRIRGQLVNQIHLPIILLSASDLNAGVQEILLAQQGSVAAPPDVSKQVTAKMGEWLAPITYASLRWNFDEQGKVTADFKGAVLDDVFGGMTLNIGDLVVVAEPEVQAGVWKITAKLPASLSITEGDDTKLGLENQNMSLGVIWEEIDDRYQGAHMAAQSLEFTEEGTRIVLEGLDTFWREATNEDGRVEGEWVIEASSLDIGQMNVSHSSGNLSLTVNYSDYDIKALEEVSAWIEQSDMESIFAGAEEQVQRLISALGNYEANLSWNDLSAVMGYGSETLQLGGLHIQTHSGVSEDDAEGRDSFSNFRIEGLNYLERGDGITVERLQLALSLKGFKPQLFSKLVNFEELSGEGLVDMLSETFNTFELAVDSGAVISVEDTQPLFTIHGLNAGLLLEDFNQMAAKALLNYEHSGFSSMVMPPEFPPESVRVNLNLEQIPWRAILAGVINEEFGSMIMAIKEQGTKLNLEAVSINFPDASLSLTGLGFLDEFDPEVDAPIFKAELQVETQKLVPFADAMRANMRESEVNEFNQFMAIVMLVAEQVEENLHRFNIDINSLGELWINEKDMSSLLHD